MKKSFIRQSATHLAAFALLFPILLLGACGQKGPLFLPGNPSEIRTEIPEQETGRELPPAGQQNTDEPDDDDKEEDEVQPE